MKQYISGMRTISIKCQLIINLSVINLIDKQNRLFQSSLLLLFVVHNIIFLCIKQKTVYNICKCKHN